jgi:tRNA-splicing ligase RtcB
MHNIKTKDLSRLGYTDNKARSLAINIISKHFKHTSKEEILGILKKVIENTDDFVTHETLGILARSLNGGEPKSYFTTYELLNETGYLKTYGAKNIEASAKQQMGIAMSLPITRQGALMPDAHAGFGLPIDGVLATKNAVVPYAVGVDIGCQMALSIVDEGESFLKSNAYNVKNALKEYTHFGMNGELPFRQEHGILDNPLFRETQLLRKLFPKAVRQLGTFGSDNHFVEMGMIELFPGNSLNLPPKKYLALLSHSGSRGLGANIAQYYTQIAMDTCKLPRAAQPFAWLDMDKEAGQEYWLSMNLAGEYAQACHDRIHVNVFNALGLQAIAKVENHHNFAWKDMLPDGQEVIIHRKGATPSHAGEMGIIPGSMATAAYLVLGKGVPEALYSASHGAGRSMSRQRAKENMTVSSLKKMLVSAGVTLIGGSVEENPLAYKDIEQVMQAQKELVEIQRRFEPKIVRMNKE